jgi:hypothetical protein
VTTPTYIVPQDGIPAALHRGESELPFVEFEPGVEMQVLQVDIPSGLWVIRMRMQPGATLPTHRHGGEVYAFTIQGAWKYLEYPKSTEPAPTSTSRRVDPHLAGAADEHRGHRRLVRDPRPEPEPRRRRRRDADPRCGTGVAGLPLEMPQARPAAART